MWVLTLTQLPPPTRSRPPGAGTGLKVSSCLAASRLLWTRVGTATGEEPLCASCFL